MSGLSVGDADEMVDVLADEALYEFTGGRPPALVELRERYRVWVAGPDNPAISWLNWTVRSRADGSAVGAVQASVTRSDGAPVDELAWVIGTRSQKQGFASEAVVALVAFLAERGVAELRAHIAACHHASAGVARHAGLHPTSEEIEGEIVWRNG
jgi:RimJ/RimL family protein N-acetyltransferase